MKFFTKDFFSKYDQIRSFTEEIRCGKLHFLCSVHVMIPGDPGTVFLASSLTQKMPESSDSMCFSLFMMENI